MPATSSETGVFLPSFHPTFQYPLRFSELVGLRVARLDLIRNRLRVEEKITESGHLIAGTPKTERARRMVTIPEFVTFALSEHVRRYPGRDGLVFTMERGGPIRRPAFYRLVWKPAVERAHLEGFRVGQLRHTGATMALEAGDEPGPGRLPPRPHVHADGRAALRGTAGSRRQGDRRGVGCSSRCGTCAARGGFTPARARAAPLLTCGFVRSPNGVRTRVSTLRGWCPRPLDDGTAGSASVATL